MSKRCPSCGETKDLLLFWNDKKRADGKQTYCIPCQRSRRQASHVKNPDARRGQWLLHNYGITADTYDHMLSAQGGVCDICGSTCATKRALAVDHNHTTGKVRALLCGACNKALGQMRDSPSLLRAAADYLDKHNGT